MISRGGGAYQCSLSGALVQSVIETSCVPHNTEGKIAGQMQSIDSLEIKYNQVTMMHK
jgi:hypothetical protein